MQTLWARAVCRERFLVHGETPAENVERRVVWLRVPDAWADATDLIARCGRAIATTYARPDAEKHDADDGHYVLEGASIQPVEASELERAWCGGPVYVVRDDGALRPADTDELPAVDPRDASLHDARRCALEERWRRVLELVSTATFEGEAKGEVARLAIQAELATGDRDAAEHRARARLSESADRAAPLEDLVTVLLAKGDTDAALPFAIELGPSGGRGAQTLGLVYLRRCELEPARIAFALALQDLDVDVGTRASALYNLGFTLARLGRLTDAHDALTRALALRSAGSIEHAQCLVALARVEAQLERPSAAVAIARATLAASDFGPVARLEARWAAAWLDASTTPGRTARELDEVAKAIDAAAGPDDLRARWVREDRANVLSVSDSALRTMFDEVTRRWSDETAHARFIAACNAAHRALEPSRYYARLAKRDPARVEDAKRRGRQSLFAITSRARAQPPSSGPRPWPLVVVVGGLAILVVWWILRS